MATSSIMKTFSITGEEAVATFIDRLTDPAQHHPIGDFPNIRQVKGPEEIRKFCEGLDRAMARFRAEDEAKAHENNK